MAEPQPSPSPGAEPKTQAQSFQEAVERSAAATLSLMPQTANPKDPMVFLGTTNLGLEGLSQADIIRAENGKLDRTVDNTATLSEVANQYYTWDQKTKDRFLTQLALTGVDVDAQPDAKLAQLWGAYAEQAASYYAAGKKLTPWDILAKDRDQREKAFIKPRSVTQTATNLDISSALTARAIFNEATRALLGRAPTKAETRSFQARLNAYERANPQTTTTTTTYAGGQVGAAGTGDVTGQTSVTKGGVAAADRAMIAEEAAKADPEYGAYQAATSGMNWLMEMVNGG